MFAIEINPMNMVEIEALECLTPEDLFSIGIYLAQNDEWYLIRGYVPPRGEPVCHTVLPKYIVKDNFEINFEKAAKDWDIIVRKL